MNNLKINKNFFIFFLLLILITITFFPLLKVGFTTADDAFSYLNLINPKGIVFISAKGIAESQSRFQYFFTFLISLIPFLFIKKIFIFKIISLGQIILNFILFSFLIYKISKSKSFTLIVFLFLSSFIQNSWQHNLLTSYPFIFSFGLNLSLFSLILFISYLNSKKIWKLICSVILFFLSLFNYEIFILFILIFFLTALFFIKDKNIFNKMKLSSIKLIYHFLVLFLFLIVYIIYRKIYPGVYDGTHSFNFNIFRIIRTAIQFSISSFPTYIYNHSIGQILTFSYTFDRALLSFKYIIKNIQLGWLIKGLISFTTCFFLLFEYKKINKKVLFFLMVLSLFFIFLPVIPQSFVNKYQDWVINRGQLSFTPTYFSFFGMILLLTSIMAFFLNRFKNKFFLLIVNVLISLLVFRTSIITDYSNYFYTLDQSQVFNVWKTIDELIKSPDFLQIPDDSIIFAPTLPKYTGRIITKDSSHMYWSEYINSKTRKKINLFVKEEELNNYPLQKLYYLGFSQELKDPNRYVILSKIDKIESNPIRKKILSNNFTIFTISKYKNYQILYSANGNFHYLTVNKDLEENVLVKTNVFDKNIDLQTVTISYYTDSLPPLNSIEYNFIEGFYNEEFDGTDIFRWSNKKSKILISSQEDKEYLLSFKMSSGFKENSNLKISSDLFQDELKINDIPKFFTKTLYIPKGIHYITFLSDAPKVISPGDNRELHFKILNFKIDEL